MTDTSDPTSIGPYYRILGVACLVGIFVLAGIQLIKGRPFDEWNAVFYGVAVILTLCLIRPALVDAAFKTIIDRLPFTKYTKGA